MERMPIKVLLLGMIPQTILMLWAGLTLLGIHRPWMKIVLVGILQGISIYFMRCYLDFDAYFVAQLFSFILYTYWIIGVNLLTVMLSVGIPMVIVILLEGCFLLFMGERMIYILWMDWIRVIMFIPCDAVLGGIIYICRKKKISLLNEFEFLNKIVGSNLKK